MNTSAYVVRFLTRVALTWIAFVGAAAGAERVRVEIAPDKVIGERAPQLFGLGGNIWWIPEALNTVVRDRIFQTKHLGLVRVSLGDQVLTESTSLDDVRRRLETYPLNDFLREYTKAGGRALFILDAMPQWLSANKSPKIFPDPGPRLKTYRMYPPADFEEWGRLVETIVRHFNGKLGLDAYYESWNEPSWQYLGTTEQYHRQYYFTVLGARRADPKAKVGGPSISDVIAGGTRGDPVSTEKEKMEMAQRVLQHDFAFKRFVEYTAKTPLPELGLKRLPLDFFSWHAYYIDPTTYYRLVVPVFRAVLTGAGYPRDTPLINTEWNLAAEPPYPEGKLNATEAGASFVATSLIAMHRAGVDGQIFQAFVDPGEPGVYLGGMFTQSGIARANFHAFRLFAELNGRELQTQTTDPWANAVAFQDAANTYLLIATFAPTPRMTQETARLEGTLRNAPFLESVAKAYRSGQKELPEALSKKAQAIAEQQKSSARETQEKAARWKKGVTLDIDLGRLRGGSGKITHYLIDSRHSNIFPDIAKAEKLVAQRRKQIEKEAADKIFPRLQSSGIPADTVERLRAAQGDPNAANKVLSSLPPEQRESVLKVLKEFGEEVRKQYLATFDEIENWPSARLHQESMNFPASGVLQVESEPYAVHLFVLPRQ